DFAESGRRSGFYRRPRDRFRTRREQPWGDDPALSGDLSRLRRRPKRDQSGAHRRGQIRRAEGLTSVIREQDARERIFDESCSRRHVMRLVSRERVMDAFLSLLAESCDFVTIGRRNRDPETLDVDESPALFLVEHSETYERPSPSLPPKRILNVRAV